MLLSHIGPLEKTPRTKSLSYVLSEQPPKQDPEASICMLCDPDCFRDEKCEEIIGLLITDVFGTDI